jgi:hypothetical protein
MLLIIQMENQLRSSALKQEPMLQLACVIMEKEWSQHHSLESLIDSGALTHLALELEGAPALVFQ